MTRVFNYIQSAYLEMTQRTSWPTTAQLRASASVVLIASLIFALIIGGVDIVFRNLMEFIYETF